MSKMNIGTCYQKYEYEYLVMDYSKLDIEELEKFLKHADSNIEHFKKRFKDSVSLLNVTDITGDSIPVYDGNVIVKAYDEDDNIELQVFKDYEDFEYTYTINDNE